MITPVLPAEIIITEAEMLAVEKYIAFLDDLMLATRAGQGLLVTEVAAAEAAAAATANAFAFNVVLGFATFIIGEIYSEQQAESEARNAEVRAQRRRKRTAICASYANRILESAGDRIRKGKFDGKPLETDDGEKRKRRSFKSRA